MKPLLHAMSTIIGIFKDYASKDGDPKTLSKAEVKTLFKEEFGAEIETAKDKGKVNDIFTSLDANKDGTVDFQEFMVLVAALTISCQMEA